MKYKITVDDLEKIILKYKDNEEKLKAILREFFKYKENIDVFSKFCFPEHIKGNVPDFHKEFYTFLVSNILSVMGLAAPRGHAKSTTAGLVFISWCLVNKLEKYIVYVSQNHSKTVQFVEPLRMEFAKNNHLRWLYGELRADKVKDEFGRDREDCIDINGCRVEAVSFEKNLRGFKYGNIRPTLIILDDVEDDERVRNPVLRLKDEQKLKKVIIPSLDINGRLKMIGTILSLDALLPKIIKESNGKIYKAIKEDGSLLWAERFTQEKLNEIKRAIGSASFEQEYQNNPVDNETSIIKREWIEQCLDENFDEKEFTYDNIYLGVDFAFSDRATADFSHFMTICTKDNKKVPLKLIWGNKGQSLNEQMQFIRDLHNQYNYNLIALEENSIKSNSKDIREFNLPIKMLWTGSRDTHNKDKYSKGSSYSKINAINRLAVEFENKMWRIPYNTDKQKEDAHRLISELTSWALEDGKLVEVGVHPDAPISMILVNEILNKQFTVDRVERNYILDNVQETLKEIEKNIDNDEEQIKKELPTLF